MATLTIKNFPDALYELLKRQASANRRSINSEAIVCLEKTLAAAPLDEREMQDRIRALRETQTAYLTDTELHTAIEGGRR